MSYKRYIIKDNVVYRNEIFSDKKIYLFYNLDSDSEIITKSDKPIDMGYAKMEKGKNYDYGSYYYDIYEGLTGEEVTRVMNNSKKNKTILKSDLSILDGNIEFLFDGYEPCLVKFNKGLIESVLYADGQRSNNLNIDFNSLMLYATSPETSRNPKNPNIKSVISKVKVSVHPILRIKNIDTKEILYVNNYRVDLINFDMKWDKIRANSVGQIKNQLPYEAEKVTPYNFESLDKCDLMKLLLLIGANYFRVEHRHLFEIIDENQIILNFFDSNLNKSNPNPNWVKLPISELIFPPVALLESDDYDKEKYKMLLTHIRLIMEITKQLNITDDTYTYNDLFSEYENKCNNGVTLIKLIKKPDIKIIVKLKCDSGECGELPAIAIAKGGYEEEYFIEFRDMNGKKIDDYKPARRYFDKDIKEVGRAISNWRKIYGLRKQRIEEPVFESRFSDDERYYVKEKQDIPGIIEKIRSKKLRTSQPFQDDSESETGGPFYGLSTSQSFRDETRKPSNYLSFLESESEIDDSESEIDDSEGQQDKPFDDLSSVLEKIYRKERNY